MNKKIKKTSRFSKSLSHFLVSVVVLLTILISLKASPNLREYVYKNVFQNNIRFARINQLYEKYLGSPLPFKINDNVSAVSSSKITYDSISKYKDGVKLMTVENYAIPLLNSGIVIFAGDKEGYGNTVIVMGADETEIWYSNLKDIKVSMYDYLKKGSIVGEANGNNFILVFTKDGKVLDYNKYI